MFASIALVLLQYFRKAFIPFCLLGLWSCKDFKNWEATYWYEVKIKFEIKKDKQVPGVVEDLGSVRLLDLHFIKHPIVTESDKKFSLTNELLIPLDPAVDEVSFELESTDQRYYQKVTICYEPIRHLISPLAGGLQIEYRIKHIQFSTKHNKSAILKEFTINNPVPLQKEKEKEKPHVTLYY
ncbi:MAG: hypothetical protein NMK33_02165 [Candidatus Cardinium sp.]|uniref:hypothetical protein n=1 Tax=Cardinium endosymbiont of Dermatophagoides farinae TaxID=2597823 RepID=UPI0011825370|nr:hypothetical protein [Cardinium endosymbiont of Dermatophagoides farinae]TSJ81287.1 hypothetical protein FPG78_04840 [Cardinium endosymbiont of Dermatophagoides farinae]UWW97346.1 MAG: hypothetical protein NMK33_02165 [Candidatus Cardinium sp.]